MKAKTYRTGLALIVNPTSGHIRYPGQVEEAREVFAAAGVSLEVMPTLGPGHAVELSRRAAAAGFSGVISMGGDGTLNEVINGLVATPGIPLGIIPAGISNVFALELGLPFSPAAAARIILAGFRRRVDLGSINGRAFSLMVSVGLDAQACKIVKAPLKKYLKRYAFHLAGLQALATFRPGPFRVILDTGEVVTGFAVVISNSRFYGGKHRITPAARLDDGALDVCVYLRGGRLDYLRYFAKVLTGKIADDPAVACRVCREVKIDAPGLPVQADGDYLGETPLEISVLPGAMEVFCPRP